MALLVGGVNRRIIVDVREAFSMKAVSFKVKRYRATVFGGRLFRGGIERGWRFHGRYSASRNPLDFDR